MNTTIGHGLSKEAVYSIIFAYAQTIQRLTYYPPSVQMVHRSMVYQFRQEYALDKANTEFDARFDDIFVEQDYKAFLDRVKNGHFDHMVPSVDDVREILYRARFQFFDERDGTMYHTSEKEIW